MIEVLTGPPGSGKTSYVLDQVRGFLRAAVEFRLIVPTNTMAEHLQNQLAREGFVFRPASIVTFSKFVEPLIPDLPKVTRAALELLVEEVLLSEPLRHLAKVKGFPGFRKAVADQIQELSAAGYCSTDVRGESEVIAEFVQVFRQIEIEVERRGWHFPAQRLRQAASRVAAIQRVVFHGFFSFTKPELGVVEALSKHGDVLVALPSWTGAKDARTALRKMGGVERECSPEAASPVHRVLVTSATADQEAEEIARRILAEHIAGRPFREIGIVVRSEHPAAGPLRGALERFCIPARFYFGIPLAENAVTAYLAGIVEAMLGGWEHRQTVAALRKAGLPKDVRADEFEYKVRTALPNAGLQSLRNLATGQYDGLFQKLERLDQWNNKAATREWAARFRGLTPLFPPPDLHDKASPEWITIWRSQAAALAGWEASIDELSRILDPNETQTCNQYWAQLKTVIEANTLRIPDNRRNVVHVIDAYEARQWKLPVVFLYGVLEKQFPKHHNESPLLSDQTRMQLRRHGVTLRTTADRQEEEEFLFDLATSRATEKLIVSYPVLNAKGDANLPSFLLEKMRRQDLFQEEQPVRIRPQPGPARRAPTAASIYDEDLRAALKARYQTFSATGLEKFLQCPYQFFAATALRLQEAPCKPDERVNPLMQGIIAHATLHRMYRDGQTLFEAFDAVWLEECLKRNVPQGYRTEAVKYELLHNLETFVCAGRLPLTPGSLFEQEFRVTLMEGVVIRGRIDRIDFDSEGRALVIDYKYKRAEGIKDLVKAHDQGLLVQGGLYLRALQSQNYQPAGMVYAGFRAGESAAGWVRKDSFPRLKGDSTEESLQQVVRKSTDIALTAIGQIHDGRIAIAPADKAKCEYCNFALTCRVETMAMPAVKRGSAQ